MCIIVCMNLIILVGKSRLKYPLYPQYHGKGTQFCAVSKFGNHTHTCVTHFGSTVGNTETMAEPSDGTIWHHCESWVYKGIIFNLKDTGSHVPDCLSVVGILFCICLLTMGLRLCTFCSLHFWTLCDHYCATIQNMIHILGLLQVVCSPHYFLY